VPSVAVTSLPTTASADAVGAELTTLLLVEPFVLVEAVIVECVAVVASPTVVELVELLDCAVFVIVVVPVVPELTTEVAAVPLGVMMLVEVVPSVAWIVVVPVGVDVPLGPSTVEFVGVFVLPRVEFVPSVDCVKLPAVSVVPDVFVADDTELTVLLCVKPVLSLAVEFVPVEAVETTVILLEPSVSPVGAVVAEL